MSAIRRGRRVGCDSVPVSAIMGFNDVVVIRYSRGNDSAQPRPPPPRSSVQGAGDRLLFQPMAGAYAANTILHASWSTAKYRVMGRISSNTASVRSKMPAWRELATTPAFHIAELASGLMPCHVRPTQDDIGRRVLREPPQRLEPRTELVVERAPPFAHDRRVRRSIVTELLNHR